MSRVDTFILFQVVDYAGWGSVVVAGFSTYIFDFGALHCVRVLVYISFSFVHSDYVISAGIGFRVASGVVASP